MPMMILSAILCPPNIFATFFALNMGLSNFGATIGEYFGVGLMVAFDVDTHKYDQLQTFIVVRSLFRLVPILLVPLLLPGGSPDNPPERRWVYDHRGGPSSSSVSSNVVERSYTVLPSHDVISTSELVALTNQS